jgi:hypothetical protein
MGGHLYTSERHLPAWAGSDGGLLIEGMSWLLAACMHGMRRYIIRPNVRRASTLWVRLALALGFIVPSACATSREGVPEGGEPKAVRMSPLPGSRLRLTFEPVAYDPAHKVLKQEEAQTALAILHAAFLAERPEIRVIAPSSPWLLEDDRGSGWESRLRERFLARFNSVLLPLPDTWAQSRFFQALKMSPRPMGAGVRQAAQELFSSPLFVASVYLSVVVYFAAWFAPEPLFTKAFAATVTAALAITVGVLELTNLALACVRLYRESETARTQEELKAAAERFGKAIGATALRVLILVVSFGVGRGLPSVPQGGLGEFLGTPRYVVERGLMLGAGATAQVVADGGLVLSGAAVGTGLCGSLSFCSTMDDPADGIGSGAKLSTRYGPPHTRQNPTHNEAIERDLASREAAGHTSLRKNKAQVNARGNRVYDDEAMKGPRFRKPDVSSVRPDGVRHNTNYVSNPRDWKREFEAFEAMKSADPDAIHELYLLDGTLLRRYVPFGVIL